ncbi:MAG TPA: transporter substrate-binding domain-containing protein [Methanospirillum sp.]|nr:transporter substrate-binding domain-containing protein [Methanospirillum sp.]
MIPPAHPDNRNDLWQEVFILFVILILIAAFCSEPVSAKDVKVGLTELKPSLYTDEQGKPTGFFVDIIENLAEKEGWNVIWISGTISDSWDRLNSGEIDLLPAVTSTPERARVYDFTNESALSIWSQVYTHPESGINTILDLDRKRVAMVRGASSGTALMDYAHKFGVNATYLEMERPADIFAAVADGKADALVVYNSAGQEDSKKYGLVATPVMFNPAQFGFAVLKGKNQDLLRVIDPYIAAGKNDTSSTYNKAMQKWYGIKGRDIIPVFLWWILGGVACLAFLFVMMSFILRREVRRKTAEIAQQNEELQLEVANRTRAEMELVQKNEEIRAAYEQLAAMEKEVRESFKELQKSQNALMQARKKLTLLNTLTVRDIKNAFFILIGYIQISRNSDSLEEAKIYFDNEEQIIQSVQNKLAFAEKFQNLGIKHPRWQTVLQVLLYAISHLDLSNISRIVDLPDIEIYADPLFEDVFFALMETIVMQGAGVTLISLKCRQTIDGITIFVESDGTGIPTEEKEEYFTWEHMGKSGTSLFLAREILSITEIALQETGEPGNGIRFEITVPKEHYRIIESGEDHNNPS